MLIAIPCFIGFIVLAKPLMILLYNDANTTPALTLALGAVTVVLYSLSTVTNSILQGLDKMAGAGKKCRAFADRPSGGVIPYADRI